MGKMEVMNCKTSSKTSLKIIYSVKSCLLLHNQRVDKFIQKTLVSSVGAG